MDYLYGKPVYFTDKITKQVQARTNKKKRISKKWLKKYGYKTVTDNQKIIVAEPHVFMSKKCYETMVKILESEKRTSP